ncbi:TetR/AcrR family transcriptional regulator [uncultured Ilumatobacter sp.]|uniref:TetR/AcrR family transcriptional regulator n=1 Tax=uncultured Ilumatobacter sp. TaxID=879968 RepID=UPI00374F85DF
MVTVPEPPIDGRRARRERSRAAVIDAVFVLVRHGKVPPTAEDVAEQAGVSVSSIFRNFDGLDDMQREAFDVFRERYVHLFDAMVDTDAPRSERVAKHVRARLDLLTVAGPMMQIARQRALDYQPIAEGVGRGRSQLSDQARAHFASEAAQLSPAGAANLLAVIDAMTSPEAYEVLQAAHGRSDRQISRSWNCSLTAILDRWPGLQPDSDHEINKETGP